MKNGRLTLWLRWVAANSLGEALGLGLTAGITAFFFSLIGETGGVFLVLASFVVAVASGAIEATILGLAQWWAMAPWFPGITRRSWWQATLIGALLAYVLGYTPSTLMNLAAETGQEAMAEPPQWLILLLAAGMGAVAGAVLSFVQCWPLRRAVGPRGWWWVGANMLAWAAGMPIIFWGIDVAWEIGQILPAILWMVAVLLLMGAVVGAIHGAVLVRLAEPPA